VNEKGHCTFLVRWGKACLPGRFESVGPAGFWLLQVVDFGQQVAAAALLQEVGDDFFVSRFVVLQQCGLEAFILARAGNVDAAALRVPTGDVHRRRERQGDGDKVLNLPYPPLARQQVLGQLQRVGLAAAGMRADEVRHEIYLFSRPAGCVGEPLLELLEDVE